MRRVSRQLLAPHRTVESQHLLAPPQLQVTKMEVEKHDHTEHRRSMKQACDPIVTQGFVIYAIILSRRETKITVEQIIPTSVG